MRGFKALLCAAALAAPLAMASPAGAQIAISIGGPPPVCPYGYYGYAPYGCAPQGFYGPGYFYNGVFLGVGPWAYWGYNHGWGGHRFYNAGGGSYRGDVRFGYHGRPGGYSYHNGSESYRGGHSYHSSSNSRGYGTKSASGYHGRPTSQGYHAQQGRPAGSPGGPPKSSGSPGRPSGGGGGRPSGGGGGHPSGGGGGHGGGDHH